jgi:radical SAM/Cys-rich protein
VSDPRVRGGKLATVSLLSRRHPLASTKDQQSRLRRLTNVPEFEAISSARGAPLERVGIDVLQLNLGKRCNQTCRHCHVDAGPDRTEVMRDDVLEASLAFADRHRIKVIDITGGAPELHPRFREIVARARRSAVTVVNRCNLTVVRLPNYADLPDFFAHHRVELVASLPWYRIDETDAQRGEGVFEASVDALRRLNRLGYGEDGTGLALHLVTNPTGAYLPAKQTDLERLWKRELERRYQVRFNRLFTITNMPIGRFLEFLEQSGQLESYMQRLVSSFNPQTLDGLMCRTTLSVAWDGRLYDCDFNQMLGIELPQTIFTADLGVLRGQAVHVGKHCFACTAGAGSSCGGAIE